MYKTTANIAISETEQWTVDALSMGNGLALTRTNGANRLVGSAVYNITHMPTGLAIVKALDFDIAAWLMGCLSALYDGWGAMESKDDIPPDVLATVRSTIEYAHLVDMSRKHTFYTGELYCERG